MQALVTKMVEAEQEEMHIPHPPETDIDAHYYTTVGITLFQMVDQNVRIFFFFFFFWVCGDFIIIFPPSA